MPPVPQVPPVPSPPKPPPSLPAHPSADGQPLPPPPPPRRSSALSLRECQPLPRWSRGRPVTASVAALRPPPPSPLTARSAPDRPITPARPEKAPALLSKVSNSAPAAQTSLQPHSEASSSPALRPSARPPRCPTSGHHVNRILRRAAACPAASASVDVRCERWRTGVMW